MQCEGPCLKHCYCSRTVAVLAYAALAYLMACIGYMAVVKCGPVGSPFGDSLTPEQIAIKKESAGSRSKIFWMSLLVATLILVLVRPLRSLDRNTVRDL